MVVLFADLLVTPLLSRRNLVRTPQLRTRNRCARIAARLQHLLYVSTAQRVLLPARMASTLRSLRSGSALVVIVDSEEGRTHMKREHRSLIVWPSLIAAGLLAAACTDQPNVSMAPKHPDFWLTPPPAQCPTGKWTGGGRIDPPRNPDTPDEAVHPDDYMTARENGKGSTEPYDLAQFEVCDNDRGQPQKGKPGPDAMRWRSEHHGDTHLIYLTGGNIVEHGS